MLTMILKYRFNDIRTGFRKSDLVREVSDNFARESEKTKLELL